jgi:hypothetical protein
MNKNEFFQSTVQHLIKQGGKAFDDITENCVYRDSNGNMCAIGCHIADEDYVPEMEGLRIIVLVLKDYCPQNIKDLFGTMPGLCNDLQSLHDMSMGNPFTFQRKVKQIAKEYDIDPAFVPDTSNFVLKV